MMIPLRANPKHELIRKLVYLLIQCSIAQRHKHVKHTEMHIVYYFYKKKEKQSNGCYIQKNKA